MRLTCSLLLLAAAAALLVRPAAAWSRELKVSTAADLLPWSARQLLLAYGWQLQRAIRAAAPTRQIWAAAPRLPASAARSSAPLAGGCRVLLSPGTCNAGRF